MDEFCSALIDLLGYEGQDPSSRRPFQRLMRMGMGRSLTTSSMRGCAAGRLSALAPSLRLSTAAYHSIRRTPGCRRLKIEFCSNASISDD